jgi:hypothetical protein
MAEKPSNFVKRASKPIGFSRVVERYYPNFKSGEMWSPITPITELLQISRIYVNKDTMTAHRKNSKRAHIHEKGILGEIFLLNALSRDKTWTTPSVANEMKRIVNAGVTIVRTNELNDYGMRRSEHLTRSIAEAIRPENSDIAFTATEKELSIVKRLLRGMRIDGAYIARKHPEAWDLLSRIRNEYIVAYRHQPPTAQTNKAMIKEMEAARNPAELYKALYKMETPGHAGKRIAAFVPYELEYWNALLESGIVDSYNHLPFSKAVIHSHGHAFVSNARLCRTIEKNIGIPVDETVIDIRGQLIRNDYPANLTR